MDWETFQDAIIFVAVVAGVILALSSITWFVSGLALGNT